jgi:hypothetical protein
MEDTMQTDTIIRARRLGSLAGSTSGHVTDARVLERIAEDWATEVRLGTLPRGWKTQRAFEQAWCTAWERGSARVGRIAAHLTAPAARARA